MSAPAHPGEPAAHTLRPVRWWDVEALAALERELFDGDAWSAETWWAELAQPGRWYVCAHPADRPEVVAGYAGASVSGTEADVMTVAVAPWAQGSGLGALLLTALVAAVRDRGARQLMLEVRADNVAAQRLYAKHGFERIAVRRGYYDGVDAWIMRLRPLPDAAAARLDSLSS
ncbi:MAG TPA: ribosomal protein S18-alanine N-acetyltransferase [Actinomycetales bacterium]